MPKITPFLWFDTQAAEAAEFYVSIFKNSRIIKTSRVPEGAPGQAGSVMVVEFELDGQRFTGLNGGPHLHFTEAISFVVDCSSQSEVDEYWNRLTEGGQESRCGWLKDRYGLSWQIIPRVLIEMLQDPDREKAGRAMAAMLQMKKIDIAALQKSYDNRA